MVTDWKHEIPKEDYYANMYDIENLTDLNYLRKNREISKEILEIENLIKDNMCGLAVTRLEEFFKSNSDVEVDFLVLYGALLIKNIVLLDINLSPKNSALKELQEYLSLSLLEIEKKMLVEKPVEESWNKFKPNPNSEEEVNDFYRKTDSYIYELMAANHIVQTLYSFYVLINKLKQIKISTILDYGAGVGTLSILLKKLGYTVIYADLPGKTFDFAKWRFKKRNLDIKMINIDKEDLSNLNFDCILSTEVVEHVVNPPKLLKLFYNNLKNNGYLIVSESCQYTEDFASHLEANKKYGGENFLKLMDEVGFENIISSPFIPQMIFKKK